VDDEIWNKWRQQVDDVMSPRVWVWRHMTSYDWNDMQVAAAPSVADDVQRRQIASHIELRPGCIELLCLHSLQTAYRHMTRSLQLFLYDYDCTQHTSLFNYSTLHTVHVSLHLNHIHNCCYTTLRWTVSERATSSKVSKTNSTHSLWLFNINKYNNLTSDPPRRIARCCHLARLIA